MPSRFVAPLRAAVLFLSTRRPRRWTVESVALLGASDFRQAKGFCGRLVRSQVLVQDEGGLLSPGRGFAEWSEMTPKTRPGGNRRILYKATPCAATA